MDVLVLCEMKMKRKGEVGFGEVTGRMSGIESGRAREGVDGRRHPLRLVRMSIHCTELHLERARKVELKLHYVM